MEKLNSEQEQNNSSMELKDSNGEKNDCCKVDSPLRKISKLLIIVILFIGTIVGIFKYADSKLKTTGERVNILILGKGGVGHSAPDLTDTIMLASVSLKNPSTTLISIPRDIWIAEIRAKINSAYYWGKEKAEFGGGIPFAKTNVERIVGVPINYGLVLDFSAFKGIVDALGGINVDVSNSFNDKFYPIVGKENDLCDGDKTFACRYQTIRFEKGIMYMDGETALKFVRSRNGDNDENTDLAREARQQKVISAIKEKALSYKTILNPIKIIRLIGAIKSNIETDLDFWSLISLGKTAIKIDGNIKSDIIPEELLVNPAKLQRYDYQYVFVPKSGDWQEIGNWVKSILN